MQRHHPNKKYLDGNTELNAHKSLKFNTKITQKFVVIRYQNLSQY